MKKSFGNYRLLANGGRRNGSLWEGPDHLLIIDSTGFLAGFSESYRRIDYRNIQAISLARTRRWGWTIAVLVALTALLSWIAFSASDAGSPGEYIFGTLALVFVIALVVHLASGRTCVCKMQTAVQFLRLKMLDRMPKASRVLARLGMLCISHQGGQPVAGEQLHAGVQAPAVPLALPPSPPSGMGHVAIAGKPAWTGSKIVTWALLLLTASGTVTIADLFIKNMLFFTLDVILLCTSFGLVVASAARSSRWLLPGALKAAIWGGVINLSITCFTAFGLQIMSQIHVQQSRGIRGDGTYEGYRFLSDAGFAELGWAAWLVVGVGAGAIFFGLLGLPSALRPPPAAPPPSPPPPPPGP